MTSLVVKILDSQRQNMRKDRVRTKAYQYLITILMLGESCEN